MIGVKREKRILSTVARKRIAAVTTYLILGLGSILFLIPFFWMISTSLKQTKEVWMYPIKWIPERLVWENYARALTVVPFGRYFLNTAFITALRIVGQVAASSVAGYAFARLRFPGRKLLFMLMLSTMMLPGIVTQIPTFVYFSRLGWVNTWNPLIVPMLFATPFNTFLLRQYYMTLPWDLDEAAKLDGCSTWQTFRKVLFPLTIPAVTAVVVFQFMEGWNDYMGPLLYLQDNDLYTVSLGLSFFQGKYKTEWQLLMAASTVAMIPSLILYAVAQKYIIGGIAFTGIKG